VKKLNRDTLISYALSFLSFAFRRPEIRDIPINKVILFGSIARGDFSDESDVDIFIDVEKQNEPNARKKFEYWLGKFRESKDHEVWELRKLKNEIKINVGKLDEWDLKESVLKEGVMLYGRPSFAMEKYFLVTFKPVKCIAKRNKVIRKLFGRNEKNYEDEGIVGSSKGEKLSPRVFIIPERSLNVTLELFSKENIDYSLKEIWF